ncbi:Ser-Thr-rich GPI-anchored membrane family protein [Chloroflexota bacterium]
MPDNQESTLSDGVFSISFPVKVTITVKEPAAGAKFNGYDTMSITWSHTGTEIATVDLQYSTDGGKNWMDIATNIPNSGKYSWKAPNVSSTQCYVKVIAHSADKTILHSDMNNTAF